jgi:hypothetical protein
MSLTETARRWAQNNPQLATTLMSMMVLAGFAAATGDLANLDGSGIDPMGGTDVTHGP